MRARTHTHTQLSKATVSLYICTRSTLLWIITSNNVLVSYLPFLTFLLTTRITSLDSIKDTLSVIRILLALFFVNVLIANIEVLDACGAVVPGQDPPVQCAKQYPIAVIVTSGIAVLLGFLPGIYDVFQC